MDYLSIRTDLMQEINFKKRLEGIIINTHELYQVYKGFFSLLFMPFYVLFLHLISLPIKYFYTKIGFLNPI